MSILLLLLLVRGKRENREAAAPTDLDYRTIINHQPIAKLVHSAQTLRRTKSITLEH